MNGRPKGGGGDVVRTVFRGVLTHGQQLVGSVGGGVQCRLPAGIAHRGFPELSGATRQEHLRDHRVQRELPRLHQFTDVRPAPHGGQRVEVLQIQRPVAHRTRQRENGEHLVELPFSIEPRGERGQLPVILGPAEAVDGSLDQFRAFRRVLSHAQVIDEQMMLGLRQGMGVDGRDQVRQRRGHVVRGLVGGPARSLLGEEDQRRQGFERAPGARDGRHGLPSGSAVVGTAVA